MANVTNNYSVQQFSHSGSSEQFGLAELTANINALNAQLTDVLPDIVMQAAEIVEAEIAARAPVDSGALVRSLNAKADRRKQSSSVTVQIDRSGPDGTEYYAIFQEFGTSKMQANPFFRPGVEASRTKVADLMERKILSVVESK